MRGGHVPSIVHAGWNGTSAFRMHVVRGLDECGGQSVVSLSGSALSKCADSARHSVEYIHFIYIIDIYFELKSSTLLYL